MERQDVYKIIDAERDYQDSLQKWNHEGHPPVAAEILLMEEYLQQAKKAWVTNSAPGEKPALAKLRSVIALGIRCMENHGAVPR